MRDTNHVINTANVDDTRSFIAKDISSLDDIDEKIFRLIQSGINSKTILSESLKLNPSELNIRLSKLEIDDFIGIKGSEIYIKNAN
jgi:DNA-binding Lrp family transcriptional regulator